MKPSGDYPAMLWLGGEGQEGVLHWQWCIGRSRANVVQQRCCVTNYCQNLVNIHKLVLEMVSSSRRVAAAKQCWLGDLDSRHCSHFWRLEVQGQGGRYVVPGESLLACWLKAPFLCPHMTKREGGRERSGRERESTRERERVRERERGISDSVSSG